MTDKRSGADPYAHLAQRTTGGGSNRGLIIGGVAILVVAVIAVLAIFLTGSDGSGVDIEAVQEAGPVEVTGEALPAFPEVAGHVAPAEADPAVGVVPPTLTGQDFAASPVSLDPTDGRAKVVVFVAHWCPHCQKEVPLLQEWVDDGNLPDSVDMWAVSTGVRSDQNNYPPSKWLSREGWTGSILLDNADTTAARAWGLTGYPYMVFLDAQGTVVRRASGEVPIDQFSALVDEIA